MCLCLCTFSPKHDFVGSCWSTHPCLWGLNVKGGYWSRPAMRSGPTLTTGPAGGVLGMVESFSPLGLPLLGYNIASIA